MQLLVTEAEKAFSEYQYNSSIQVSCQLVTIYVLGDFLFRIYVRKCAES